MGYDIPYLKDCLGQAIGYVRPLQKDFIAVHFPYK